MLGQPLYSTPPQIKVKIYPENVHQHADPQFIKDWFKKAKETIEKYGGLCIKIPINIINWLLNRYNLNF